MGQHSAEVAFSLLPQQPRFDSQHSPKFIFAFAEIYRQHYEGSRQRFANVDPGHLVTETLGNGFRSSGRALDYGFHGHVFRSQS